jgi:hypothetical protein
VGGCLQSGENEKPVLGAYRPAHVAQDWRSDIGAETHFDVSTFGLFDFSPLRATGYRLLFN